MKKDKTMVQEIKEYVRGEIEEVKRHMSVLTEDMCSQVKLIAEQYGSFIDRFDRVDSKLEEHDRRFEAIDVKLKEHDIRFDRVDLDLKGMQVALFDNSHRLTDHDARIRKLEMS